jgi:histidinol-phosphatase
LQGAETLALRIPDDASPELRAALEASVVAADIARRYYRSNLEIGTKADRTPVTQADVDCERAIRSIILEAFPDHGFYGEETGRSGGDSDCLWLVDPIDGTKGFVREYPFFSTQIALMERGTLRLGVSNGIMFDEIAWAERGKGAWINGTRLSISAIDDLERCAVSTGNLKSLAASPGWAALGDIVRLADRIRGYGDFYHYHLLAAGKIEAVIESDVNILDIAALAVVVEEAGGVFTDLDGNPPGLETRSVLAANPRLHRQLQGALAGFVG